jgi:enoyl-CoA hydratase
VAGGLELALWCDLRVAGEDAVFGCFERRFGVPLVDGGTVRLPLVVGLSRALDLILTGRPIDAAEAHRIGLVDRVVSPDTELAATLDLAEMIAAFPQPTVRSDRASVYAAVGLPITSGLVSENRLGHGVLHDALAGAARFRSNRESDSSAP